MLHPFNKYGLLNSSKIFDESNKNVYQKIINCNQNMESDILAPLPFEFGLNFGELDVVHFLFVSARKIFRSCKKYKKVNKIWFQEECPQKSEHEGTSKADESSKSKKGILQPTSKRFWRCWNWRKYHNPGEAESHSGQKSKELEIALERYNKEESHDG